VRDVLGRHPAPVVLAQELGAIRRPAHAPADRAAALGRVDGVDRHVEDELAELGAVALLEVIDVSVRLDGATRRIRFLEVGVATYERFLLPTGDLFQPDPVESTTVQSQASSGCTTLFSALTMPIPCPRTNIAGETHVVGECTETGPAASCVQSVIGERVMSDLVTAPVTITCTYLDGVLVDPAQLPALGESGAFTATSTWCEVAYETSYRLRELVTVAVIFGSFVDASGCRIRVVIQGSAPIQRSPAGALAAGPVAGTHSATCQPTTTPILGAFVARSLDVTATPPTTVVAVAGTVLAEHRPVSKIS
jgi:hypothetical protein